MKIPRPDVPVAPPGRRKTVSRHQEPAEPANGPPDPFLGVSETKQALYIAEGALRAYRAPRVDMLVQFLVQDEPDTARWQSGILTAAGAKKPSYAAFELPLAVERRSPTSVTLWGQIRPSTTARSSTRSTRYAPGTSVGSPGGSPATRRTTVSSGSLPARMSASASSRPRSRTHVS